MASSDSHTSVEPPTLTSPAGGATPSASEPSTSALEQSLPTLLNQLPWDERQHRRLTWQQRHARNALGPGASVSIYLIGDVAVVKRHLPDAQASCLAA
jgi:hypothetical protein